MTNFTDSDTSESNANPELTMTIKRKGKDEFVDLHEPFASPLSIAY